MADVLQIFSEMKTFLKFDETDVTTLKGLEQVFDKHGQGITDSFYNTLTNFPITAKLIEGRVDSLKVTHMRWMNELFCGDYGETYFQSRMRIGYAHVRINLPPYYVEGVMNAMRSGGFAAIMAETTDPVLAGQRYTSLLKILDLDLLIINLAYGEERLDRVSAVTGMKRALIENLIKIGKK